MKEKNQDTAALEIADLRTGPELDQLTPLDMKRIQAEQLRRAARHMRVALTTRRAVYQAWGHAEKMLDLLWSFRDRAKKGRKYDEVADLTAAIFHLKRALAHLRHFSNREYQKDPEDLAGYK